MVSTSLGPSTSTSGGGQEAGGNSEGGLRRSTSSSVVGQAGEVVEVKEGDEASATTSPFDRLPDELLSHVLSFVQPETVSLSSVSLNKRLNRLAVPLWIKSHAPSVRSQPKLLQLLTLRPDLQPLVGSFSWTFTNTLTIPYEFTALRLFTNLRRLHLDMAEEIEQSDFLVLPHAFTEALKAMQQLVSLIIETETPLLFDDTSFSIGQDLPGLRHLHVSFYAPASSPLRQLMRHACPSLQSFTILDACEDDNTYDLIPWSTLKSVTVQEADSTGRGLKAVLHSLQAALSHASAGDLQLRKVTLDRTVFSPDFLSTTTTTLLELLELLNTVGVKHLSLRLAGHSPAIPSSLTPLPGIEELDLLTGLVDMYQPANFRSFSRLLLAFPSLQHLNLYSANFGDTFTLYEPPTAHYTSEIDFITYNPTLPALLLLLRHHTPVKTLSWTRLSARHVWTRSSSEDDFEVETFRW